MFRPTIRPLILLTLALATTAGCSRAPERPAAEEEATAIPVAATPVQRGRLRAVIHASGIITPADGAEYLVVAPEPARILEITKMEGDMVAPNEPLVRFEAPFATQEVSRQRAELARAQSQLENARVAQARARDLVTRGLIARTELDGADREYAEADTATARARSALAAAEAAVARATVRAPFAGVISKRLHNVGDVAQPSPTDPVLRLIDPQRLEVMATIAADIAPRVLPGASARIASAVEAERVPMIVTAQPNNAQRAADGSVRIRLAFQAPVSLPVDTAVELDIDAEERNNVLFVSPEALVRSGAETAVFVAVGNRAARRIVTTGVEEEQGVEITAGLNPGDLVISRGQAGLADGAQINVDIAR